MTAGGSKLGHTRIVIDVMLVVFLRSFKPYERCCGKKNFDIMCLS
uniref:Uncharacterized protein n=1 Tax=Rhodnius prolixus TaxID=13249 RepID=T1I9Y1_RHOPR